MTIRYCPFCKEKIKRHAVVCPHCTHTIGPDVSAVGIFFTITFIMACLVWVSIYHPEWML